MKISSKSSLPAQAAKVKSERLVPTKRSTCFYVAATKILLHEYLRSKRAQKAERRSSSLHCAAAPRKCWLIKPIRTCSIAWLFRAASKSKARNFWESHRKASEKARSADSDVFWLLGEHRFDQQDANCTKRFEEHFNIWIACNKALRYNLESLLRVDLPNA